MSPARDDYTRAVGRWLKERHEIVDQKNQILEMAGLQWGLALAVRHPKYAGEAHRRFTQDYKERLAGSVNSFNLMASGDGDERTSPEILADQLVKEVAIFDFQA